MGLSDFLEIFLYMKNPYIHSLLLIFRYLFVCSFFRCVAGEWGVFHLNRVLPLPLLLTSHLPHWITMR